MALQYLPIVVMMALGFAFAGGTLLAAQLLAPRRPDPVKDGVYECGIDPVGDARLRHSVRFYVVAMLFIVFDLETVFLYPWAVTYRKLALFGLVEMLVFLAILMLGLVYVWKRGALDWSQRQEEPTSEEERRALSRRMLAGGGAIDSAFAMEDAIEQRR